MAKTGRNIIHYPLVALLYFLCVLLLLFHNGVAAFLVILSVFFLGRWLIRYVNGHATSGLKILKNGFLIFSLITWAFVFTLVRSASNYAYFMEREAALQVMDQGVWTDINFAKHIDLSEQFTHPNTSHKTLKIKRFQSSIPGKLLNFMVAQEINVFFFKPSNDFYLLAAVNDNFSPLNIHEANRRKESDFVINSSFYDPQNNAIGEIIYQGKRFQQKTESSGYFKVIHGIPHAGPASIFRDIQGSPTYSCQAHPSTIKNGSLFNYIDAESMQSIWKVKTYRNLIGEMKDGTLVVLASGRGGLLDVKEISQLALLIGLEHATLFDAGSALQYQYHVGDHNVAFSAFNNSFDLGIIADKIMMKLLRKKFIQRSPVYIGVKIKP
jgi:hypothetical protein